MRNNYWARIRKTRLTNMDHREWLIKIYSPDAKGYFDYIGTSRAETFEQAIKIAHMNIKYEVKKKIERERQVTKNNLRD